MKGKSVPLAWVVGALLLAATIGIPAWLLNRPSANSMDHATDVDSLDVVCTGRVDAEGQVRSLDPPQPGRVVAVHIAEGVEVKEGQPIVSIDDRAFADLERDAVAAREEAKNALTAAIERKEKTTPMEISSLRKKIAAAEEEVKAAAMNLELMRKQKAATNGVPFTQSDINTLEGKIRAARLNIEAEQMRLDQLEKLDTTLEVKAAQYRVDAAETAIKNAQRYRSDCVIRAPADGSIIRLQVAKGTMLAPASPIDPQIVFAPKGPFIVRAEVEQADAGRIAPGMTVTMRDDSRRDSPTWTGKVADISRWIAKKRLIFLDPGEFNDVRTLEVTVKLDPSPDRLWIGQRMVVRIGK